MMRTIFVFTALLAFAIAPAASDTASKDGSPVIVNPGDDSAPSYIRTDYEYNTGGTIDFVPTTGGSHDGWGEWFVTTVYNNTGYDITLVELGFPCCGPPTEEFGWLVWTNVGGIVPPSGNAYTADYYGPFTPVDPNPETFPPTVYTYIDISAEGILFEDGTYLCFGYDNTGNGGQTDFNGVDTWAWYNNMWDPDQSWGRTAILQIKGNYGVTPADETSWGAVKSLFR